MLARIVQEMRIRLACVRSSRSPQGGRPCAGAALAEVRLLLPLAILLPVLIIGQGCSEKGGGPEEGKWQIYGPETFTEAQGLLAFDGTHVLDMKLRPVGSDAKMADPLFTLREVQVAGSRLSTEARSFEGTYAGLFGGLDDARVVWSASSSRETPDSPREALDIYLFDPKVGATTKLTNDDRADIEPVIGSPWVAWVKETAGEGKESRIILSDLARGTTTEVSPAAVADTHPALDSVGNLVWQRHTPTGWEIWHRDLATGEDRRLAGPFPGTPEGAQPRVDQGRVVWVAEVPEGRAVFLFDLTTAESSATAQKLADGPSIRQANVAGKLVVWEELSELSTDTPRVVLHDLSSGSEQVLAEGDAFVPLDLIRLSESLAVFSAPSDGGFSVKAYDAQSGTMSIVFDTDPGMGSAPQTFVAGKRILWEVGNEQGGVDLYLAILPTASGD